MTQTVLILGASGRIGRHAARAFGAAGWRVRAYKRGTDMTQSAQGCDVIVNGLNPPNYHNWARLIPQITAQTIAAAKASGATVIIPGNVYHFGDTPGLWSENTPPRPVARKGHIRLEMERAYKASGVQTIVLRAGNFIDPDRQGCMLTEMYLRRPGTFTLPGPADVRQAFCYLPDWASAAVQLADMRKSLAGYEDIPFPGHTLTADELKTAVEAITGTRLKIVQLPWWLFTLAAPIWEMGRELREMRYLWQTDHALDGTRLAALLPEFEGTSLTDVLRRYLADAPALAGHPQLA
ncbi:MAG: epimerase [Pseudomonadota bacterium]